MKLSLYKCIVALISFYAYITAFISTAYIYK